MQSFLQYRRFGRQVEEQLSKERRRAEILNRQDGPDSPVTEDDIVAVEEKEEEEEDPYVDLEKAGVDAEDRARTAPATSAGDDEQRRERRESDESSDAEAGTQELRGGPGGSLHRTVSRTSTQSGHSAGAALGSTLTGVDVRNRTTNDGGDKDAKVFVVGYRGDTDPMDPHNWSFLLRIRATIGVAAIGAIVGFASSIDSSALKLAAKEFGVSLPVESLATGLYLAGFGVGSLFAGPFSETLGRNPIYIVTLGLYMIFIMASGLAPNIGAQLTFRFLAGFFGSTPLTCAGGSVADLWTPMERTFAFPVFANSAFMGPILGPVVGGFIVQSPYLSWRWTEWITLIISGLVLANVVFFQPETYPGILLSWKAAHLRRVTGDDRYRAPLEVRQDTLVHRLRVAVYRPFVMTAQEPIIILVALYLTVIYVVLFTFLDGYDFIFAQIHGTSPGITGLCFVGIAIGLFGASAMVPLIYKWAKRDLQQIKEAGGDRLPPEFRLWFAMLGGSVAIPVSLFWMGWTSYPSISIWSPIIASVLFGAGILTVFISCYQYIIDSYELYSASALASITFIRYLASGGMVVVGIPFYANLGVQYTCTILGCISAIMVPVPYAFYKWGPKIRKMSKWAPK